MTDQELMEHVANLLADWPTEGTRAVMSAHFLLRERLAQPAAEVEEGCTPADARKLREANHALAQENHELRERLAQPDPEPFGYFQRSGMHIEQVQGKFRNDPDVFPLYTHPPRRQWQGLTESEIVKIVRRLGWGQNDFDVWEIAEVARAIEVALKEKNNA